MRRLSGTRVSSPMAAAAVATSLILLVVVFPVSECGLPLPWMTAWPIPPQDVGLLQFPFNLEFLETELFLHSALGYGLDRVNKSVTLGGPPPRGGQMAALSANLRDIITQFAWQEVGHLKAISGTVQLLPRPLLDLSPETFRNFVDTAVGFKSNPPFNLYKSDINFLLAAYIIPYGGLNGYVGGLPILMDSRSKRLVAGLLASEAGQDAVLRTELYKAKDVAVKEYRSMTVSEITSKISDLRNKLANPGSSRDEGIVVPKQLGAEGKTTGNVLVGDVYSLAFGRTPEQILSMLYGTGDPRKPGGLLPDGGVGVIARSYYSK